MKRKYGIEVGENYNLRKAMRRMDCLQADSTTAANLGKLVSQGMPKSEDNKRPQCPKEKEKWEAKTEYTRLRKILHKDGYIRIAPEL